MRLASIVCAALLVLAGDEAFAKVFSPTVFKLANGLELVVIEDHLAPVVTQMVWYRTGAADEEAGHSGIAHFLEHLMFKGTPSVSAGEFSKIVARNGGEDNAFTYYDYTAYFQTIRADRLELVMKLESDRMQNLSLTDDQVYPERDVIVEERRQRIDSSPEARLVEAMRYSLLTNSPYGRPAIGWKQEMEQLTTADAIAWYKKWYTPSNATLIVVGDVKPDEVKALADKYYGPIPSHPVPDRIRPQIAPLTGADRRVTLRDGNIHQPDFIRMYVAPNYSAKTRKQALALEVFDVIFGTGTTSRLYQTLAVKLKVATGASSSYDDTAIDPTAYDISATPAPGKDVADVEKGVDLVIRTLLKDGVTDAEVADAKTRLEAQAILARDSLSGPAHSIGEAVSTGQTIDDVENWPDNIAAVTTADVNEAMRAVLGPDGVSVTGWLLPTEGSKAPMDAAAAANTTPIPVGPIR
ncbi:MAG: peptidase [Rhodospirillales bacterium]|nr:peptidase [Rhodospirillales bacterium]